MFEAHGKTRRENDTVKTIKHERETVVISRTPARKKLRPHKSLKQRRVSNVFALEREPHDIEAKTMLAKQLDDEKLCALEKRLAAQRTPVDKDDVCQ